MIVPSMSNNEILKEMLKDLREVKEHFGKHYKTCFKHQVLQAAKFPFIPSPLHFTSSRRNKYLIYIEARKRGDWQTDRFHYICYAGNKAYMFNKRDNVFTVFIPHFFSRYRERYIKNDRITTKQVIERFFKHNLSLTCRVKEHNNSFMGTCEEGIVFGDYENGIAIIKTFISREMQFEKQKNLCNSIDRFRQDLWEQLA